MNAHSVFRGVIVHNRYRTSVNISASAQVINQHGARRSRAYNKQALAVLFAFYAGLNQPGQIKAETRAYNENQGYEHVIEIIGEGKLNARVQQAVR